MAPGHAAECAASGAETTPAARHERLATKSATVSTVERGRKPTSSIRRLQSIVRPWRSHAPPPGGSSREAEPAAGPSAAPNSGAGTGSGSLPARRSRRDSEMLPSPATFTGPAHRAPDRRLERADRVVGVHELQQRVVAELGRDDRLPQVSRERRVDVAAERGLVAQHHHRRPRGSGGRSSRSSSRAPRRRAGTGSAAGSAAPCPR